MPEPLGDPVQVARVLREIGQSFDDYRIVATRERGEGGGAVPRTPSWWCRRPTSTTTSPTSVG